MWFRNIQAFQFSEPFVMSQEVLNRQLQEFGFRPVSSVEVMSKGWVAPSKEDSAPLVHAANGFLMMCLKIEEKIIPASVVRQGVEEKVKALEAREGRPLYKKEKQLLKEEVYQVLLGRAFSRSTHIYGYIDTLEGWLFIDAGSSKKAELFTTELRRALGSLKIVLPEVMDVSTVLTDWVVKKRLPAEFAISDSCVLQDEKTSGLIRCQRQNILSADIQSLFEEGREVVQLGLGFCDLLSFVLKRDFSIRNLKFLSEIKAEASEVFTETAQQRFDADFLLMAETLRGFWKALYAVFRRHAAKNDLTTLMSEATV